MQLGLWPCATASCSSALPDRTVTTSYQHVWLLNPKQLEWNKVSMPNFQIRKSKSMCKRTEHGSDGIQSPQCHQTHMRYSWDIEQVAECHKGWRTTPCQLGACRHSLWHVLAGIDPLIPRLGGRKVAGGEGTKLPLRLYTFLSSSSVTVCPHVSPRVAGCLQAEEVSSMGRRPAALPAAEGQTFPRSTSTRFLPLCTWSSKQRL